MMLMNMSAIAPACRGLRSGLPARPAAAAAASARPQRNIVVRYREEKQSEVERLEQQLSKDAQTPTDAANKFSPDQIEQVGSCSCLCL
jgi:hypothetical protein